MPLIIYVYGVSEKRFFIQSWVLIFVAALQGRHLFILENIQKSVFMNREGNITDIDYHMYNNIPYEDCRCNVISNELCLSNLHIKYTYILPLIVFVLDVYILKDLLSLHRYREYFFLENLYWISSIFLFFCVLILIYQNSQYYFITTCNLAYLGMILYFLSAASIVVS